MNGIAIFILIIGIILCIAGGYIYYNQKQKDTETENANEELRKTNKELTDEEHHLMSKLLVLHQQEQNTSEKIKQLESLISDMNGSAAAAYEQYCDALDISYKQKEEEFENSINILDESYSMAQDNWIEKQNAILKDLDKITKTRAAAIEAQLKEQEIKDAKAFYSIQIPLVELKDVKILQDIEVKLNNPRVLRMLIWQTFYREPMNKLCNNVIGANVKIGIYKITNQINNMCYVGQSVDIAKRWKDHAKCGLGIDAPASNLLYRAMQLDGLENFTWEVLEECKQSELNEKEKYFIQLYQSDKYGYNQTAGNK